MLGLWGIARRSTLLFSCARFVISLVVISALFGTGLSSTSMALPVSSREPDDLAEFRALQNQTTKPTVEQVVRIYQKVYTISELDRIYSDYKGAYTKYHKPGAQVVTSLESLFPHALFASLGRDAFASADFLEAFYLHFGIRNKVVRLGASTGTFTGELRNLQTQIEFLISNGLNPEAVARGEQAFVMMDRTSFGDNSQSTRMAAAAYASLKGHQFDPKTIFQNLAFLSSYWAGGAVAVDYLLGSQTRDSIFSAIRVHQSRQSAAIRIQGLDSFVDWPALAWHDTFLPDLVKLPDGRLSGRPGQSLRTRNDTTSTDVMYSLYRMVQEPAFLAGVSSLSQQHLGYDLVARLHEQGKKQQDGLLDIPRPIVARRPSLAELFSEAADIMIKDELALQRKRAQLPEADSKVSSARRTWALSEAMALLNGEAENIRKFLAASGDDLTTEQIDIHVRTVRMALHDEIERGMLIADGRMIADVKNQVASLTKIPPTDLATAENQKKQYLTSNGKLVLSALQTVAQQYGSSFQTWINFLQLIIELNNSELISDRDLRRLSIYSLALAEPYLAQGSTEDGRAEVGSQLWEEQTNLNADERVAAIVRHQNQKEHLYLMERLLGEPASAKLLKTLEERSEVYLTSPRYDGLAAKSYQRLVDYGLIHPRKPESCEQLLAPSKEDSPDKVEPAA